MKETLLIIFFMLRAVFSLAGDKEGAKAEKQRLFTYTVEWGASGNWFNYNVSTYITDVQSLVNIRNINPFFHLNGELMAGVGLNVGKRLNLSLLTGYCGIQKGVRFYPAELRASVFLQPGRSKGAFFFLGGGGGICEERRQKTAFFGRGGYGYRFDIGSGAALDFRAALQGAYSHPDVTDKYTGKIVQQSNLRRSKSISINTIFSVALVF